MTQSLTEVFVTIGETAYETETPICFFIDEIQYMKSDELGALIAAIHRTNQLGYPVMIIGAGLPKIYKMLSDEKSYSERLFLYKEIDSLTEEQSRKAIEEPAKKFVFAMVKCGELPCTISNVAKNLHKSVNAISTTRAQLISKGIIYPVRYKELDFTVPEFTGYIQRLDEYKQWCEEN